jgi:hypothetical protein
MGICIGTMASVSSVQSLAAGCFSVFWDVINAAGQTQDSQYIKRCCIDLMQELRTVTGVKVLGFVTESASANRAALSLLQQNFPQLMNLPCIAHALSVINPST